jgi:ribosomal protein S13
MKNNTLKNILIKNTGINQTTAHIVHSKIGINLRKSTVFIKEKKQTFIQKFCKNLILDRKLKENIADNIEFKKKLRNYKSLITKYNIKYKYDRKAKKRILL